MCFNASAAEFVEHSVPRAHLGSLHPFLTFDRIKKDNEKTSQDKFKSEINQIKTMGSRNHRTTAVSSSLFFIIVMKINVVLLQLLV